MQVDVDSQIHALERRGKKGTLKLSSPEWFSTMLSV